MDTEQMMQCNVTGCTGVKRHRLRVGPCMKFDVCDRCHETVYALGKRYDREYIDLEEKFFKLFKGLKGGKG